MDDKGTESEEVSTSHVMLSSVRPGTTVKLIGIATWYGHGRNRHGHHHHGRFGRHRGIWRRLLELGLTKGCTFEVVQAGSHGPILVQVRGTRIALGRGIVDRIIVEVVS
ncbi:MAG: ferrous iron transport protein A [Candidatus Thorarchaeota archaeon]|nr:MAG: ferrous iron transport protein A [Candidatus Thorarchaeota archaeon]